MTSYHINQTTGRPNLCEASERACPVGGAHFTSKEDARAGYEIQMSQKTVPPAAKKSSPKVEEIPFNWDEMGSSEKDRWVERNGWPDAKVQIFAGAIEPGDRLYGGGSEFTVKSKNRTDQGWAIVFTDGKTSTIGLNAVVNANKSK